MMTHFEYLEQQGQMNIFDFLSVQESDQLKVGWLPSTIDIGDEVMIVLPDPEKHSDIYYFLLYYYSQIINKRGIVIDKKNKSYLISVEGICIWLSAVELEKTTP